MLLNQLNTYSGDTDKNRALGKTIAEIFAVDTSPFQHYALRFWTPRTRTRSNPHTLTCYRTLAAPPNTLLNYARPHRHRSSLFWPLLSQPQISAPG